MGAALGERGIEPAHRSAGGATALSKPNSSDFFFYISPSRELSHRVPGAGGLGLLRAGSSASPGVLAPMELRWDAEPPGLPERSTAIRNLSVPSCWCYTSSSSLLGPRRVVGACGEAPPEAGLAVAPSQALMHTAAVWPPSCKAASGPRCLLTNIISAGIYISLTTLSQNGIKSNTNDK